VFTHGGIVYDTLLSVNPCPKNLTSFCKGHANGMRYLRWGGDGEAVQPEK